MPYLRLARGAARCHCDRSGDGEPMMLLPSSLVFSFLREVDWVACCDLRWMQGLYPGGRLRRWPEDATCALKAPLRLQRSFLPHRGGWDQVTCMGAEPIAAIEALVVSSRVRLGKVRTKVAEPSSIVLRFYQAVTGRHAGFISLSGVRVRRAKEMTSRTPPFIFLCSGNWLHAKLTGGKPTTRYSHLYEISLYKNCLGGRDCHVVHWRNFRSRDMDLFRPAGQ